MAANNVNLNLINSHYFIELLQFFNSLGVSYYSNLLSFKQNSSFPSAYTLRKFILNKAETITEHNKGIIAIPI